MATASQAFKWSENMACVATYKILEGDMFLDQFEDSDISFKQAPTVKMAKLRYFPKTTSNPAILEMLGLEISRAFLKHLVKTYTVKKQLPATESSAIIAAIGAVFQKKDATINDLAEVVDAQIKFPDEV